MIGMMVLGNILWLVLLVVLGLAIMQWYRHPPRITSGEDSPLAILELRLARGDISLKEYDEIRQRLTSS